MPYIVFGYGTPGFLKGYVRRFAQESHDHRGTEENPGRVVTLIHKEEWDLFSGSDSFPDEDIVWGVAFTIDPAFEEEVRDYLEYREKDGYTKETIDIWGVSVTGEDIVVVHGATAYVGRRDNPSFIGSEHLDVLSERIHRSVGPSGKNKDYLFQLANAVRMLSPNSFDSHLFALEERVRALDAE
ncbi:ChaC-like protein [Flagelloscypha sp. PMI_526]|nr:ChaC-like protein [Flagelloscypha sp. PMI_526]